MGKNSWIAGLGVQSVWHHSFHVSSDPRLQLLVGKDRNSIRKCSVLWSSNQDSCLKSPSCQFPNCRTHLMKGSDNRDVFQNNAACSNEFTFVAWVDTFALGEWSIWRVTLARVKASSNGLKALCDWHRLTSVCDGTKSVHLTCRRGCWGGLVKLNTARWKWEIFKSGCSLRLHPLFKIDRWYTND